MVQRTRRANAGNRLQSLLSEQIPLDDEDAEFFAERDDDEDFDIEAEEERQRQKRIAAEQEADEEEGSGNDDESGDGSDDDGSGEEGSEEVDDENFSESTDSSDSDRDEEVVDAGEKELQKEQRRHTKEKRIAERNKIFKIKRRPPPEEEKPVSHEPKRKRVFMSADILLEKGRHSERKSALRNKHHLIELMREAEERRAQYVPPKRKKVIKLTQEQRLEEAKKTEARNLSSLNKFVELEEERKIQQRLAMISRRPKLTHFVRFHSSQYMEPPKLITVKEDNDELDENDVKRESSTTPPPSYSSSSNGLSMPIKQESDTKPERLTDAKPESIKTTELKMEPSESQKSKESQPESTQEPKPGLQQPPPQQQESPKDSEKDSQQNQESQPVNPPVVEGPSTITTGTPNIADTAKNDVIEAANASDPDAQNENGEINGPSSELKEEVKEVLPEVFGPPRLKTYNFLTLHEFQDVHINKYSIRSIVLGPIASSHPQPPQKRMCPFSGKEAKYVDPKTDVAYTGLETRRLLELVKENNLGWSKELGGVFTSTGNPPRHAKGVPEGFY